MIKTLQFIQNKFYLLRIYNIILKISIPDCMNLIGCELYAYLGISRPRKVGDTGETEHNLAGLGR